MHHPPPESQKNSTIPRDPETEMEDINTFWENIQTSNTPSPKESKIPNEKKKNSPKISYPDALSSDGHANQTKTKPSRAVLAMLERLHTNDSTADDTFLSPSNLSRVSTAPPSATSREDDDDDDDDDSNLMSLSDDNEEEEEEDLFPTTNDNEYDEDIITSPSISHDNKSEEEDAMEKAAQLLPSPPSITTNRTSLASSSVVEQDSIVDDLEEGVDDFLNNTSGFSSASSPLSSPSKKKNATHFSSTSSSSGKLTHDVESPSVTLVSSPSSRNSNQTKKVSVYSEENYSTKKQQQRSRSSPVSKASSSSPSSSKNKSSTMLPHDDLSSSSIDQERILNSSTGDKSSSLGKINSKSSSDDATVDRSHDVLRENLSSPPSAKIGVTSPIQEVPHPDEDDLQYSRDDDDDDDKEGPGFTTVHHEDDDDDEEEESPQPVIKPKRKQKSNNKDSSPPKAKKRKTKVPSKRRKVTPSPSSRRVTFSTGYQAANRDYEMHPMSYYNNTDSPTTTDNNDAPDGARRSRRAKVKPLQFWKNERLIYSADDDHVPVVKGVLTALPTPYKQRNKYEKRDDSATDDDDKPSKKSKKRQNNNEEIPIFDDSKLRKNNYIMDKDNDRALVLDSSSNEITEKKLIAFSSKMQSTKLPVTRARQKHESKVVGKAAQAFNIPTTTIPNNNNDDDTTAQLPGWISGYLHLPPMGIKDAEGVGSCAQVFFIQHCQPNAIEVAYADPEEEEFQLDTAQRFLLNPGDFFHIPPNNVYRIENHSKDMESRLAWTIIRPFS